MTDIETGAIGPQAAYEAHLAAGRFMIQRARSTGEYVFWPKITSPSGATDLEWVAAKGTGTIHAITVNRARSGSWNVALVELDEGVRMMSTLPGVETAEIDARVMARIENTEEGPRVVFDLATEGTA
ncbi:Zn-ribbon domain-containing OB-fold protein [Tritonibacter scottomollicae]|uniref:Zn-ribbon domain-containing OB-fold protein n=1 Tax=Tritonibacter scottomollicae TaxID=483013 RepID=UPI003AA804DE